MKIIKHGGIPWWVGKTIKCEFGFEAELEVKDDLNSKYIPTTEADVFKHECPDCTQTIKIQRAINQPKYTRHGQ